jgi:hypothetical protein
MQGKTTKESITKIRQSLELLSLYLLVIAGEGDAGDDHKNKTKSLALLSLYLLVIAGEFGEGDDHKREHHKNKTKCLVLLSLYL